LIVICPAGAALSLLINRIVMSVDDSARRSGLRFVAGEAWVIYPMSPKTSLIVAGRPVTRFVRSVLVFWNGGSRTIRREDLPYATPIRFLLSGDMLDAPHVLCARGTGVRFTQGGANEVIAEFDVLHSGDGGSVEIVHDGSGSRASLNTPWDRLEPRLRLWPILLILPILLGFVGDLIHPFLGLPSWAKIGIGVSLLAVIGRNCVHIVYLLIMLLVRSTTDSQLGSPRVMDDTDLWLRRVPKQLRNTTSGKYTDVPGGRRS
jgi:hypothetical protein